MNFLTDLRLFTNHWPFYKVRSGLNDVCDLKNITPGIDRVTFRKIIEKVAKMRYNNTKLPELALVQEPHGLQREANQHFADELFEKDFVDQLYSLDETFGFLFLKCYPVNNKEKNKYSNN